MDPVLASCAGHHPRDVVDDEETRGSLKHAGVKTWEKPQKPGSLEDVDSDLPSLQFLSLSYCAMLRKRHFLSVSVEIPGTGVCICDLAEGRQL